MTGNIIVERLRLTFKRRTPTKKIVISVGNESSFYIAKPGRDYLREKLGIKNDDEYAIVNDYRTQSNGRTRDDPILVEMLEKLGEKAYVDADCNDWKLAIIEIPADTDYTIGVLGDSLCEYVEEKPHKWYYVK